VRLPSFFARYLTRQFRRANGLTRTATVVDHLFRHELRLEIIQRIRPVQRPQGEIVNRELMLGEQRAKDKHRIIAAGERFGVVQLRQPRAAGFADTRFRGTGARRGGRDGWVMRQGLPHGFRERKLVLRRKRGDQ